MNTRNSNCVANGYFNGPCFSSIDAHIIWIPTKNCNGYESRMPSDTITLMVCANLEIEFERKNEFNNLNGVTLGRIDLRFFWIQIQCQTALDSFTPFPIAEESARNEQHWNEYHSGVEYAECPIELGRFLHHILQGQHQRNALVCKNGRSEENYDWRIRKSLASNSSIDKCVDSDLRGRSFHSPTNRRSVMAGNPWNA